MFEQVKAGPKDPMFDLKKRADGDTTPSKVDLGVGIYRSPEGLYQELDVVRRVSYATQQLRFIGSWRMKGYVLTSEICRLKEFSVPTIQVTM